MSTKHYFYQLYDSTGPVNSYKRVSASNNSIGRIDLAGIAPPKNVTEVVKAISDQEGCKDTFISCDWSVYQNSTSSAALSEAALVPQGAGLEPTNPLILRFDADVGLERGRSLVESYAHRRQTGSAAQAPPAYNDVVLELSGTWTWDTYINETGSQSILSKGSITFEPLTRQPVEPGARKRYTGHGTSTYLTEHQREPSSPSFRLEVTDCAVDVDQISFAWKRDDGFIWDFTGTWKNARTFTASGTLRGLDEGFPQMTFHKQ